MNLQPVYAVKERLEHTILAGTNLLPEDFRLRRAAEELAPLAAASPVFARIDAGVKQLLQAPAEARASLLLDTLALVDAVLYTQAVTGLDGEASPLPVGGGQYVPLRHSQLQPLLTALSTTGSGRFEVLRSAVDSHSPALGDYRVLSAMVHGLGDPYGEMAELIAHCLMQGGPAVVPLLKAGFDPAGGREMVRRVEILAGLDTDNTWFVTQLDTAQKEVREALIHALGRHSENAPLLRDLVKAEKGRARKAALWSLAQMEDAETVAFWTKEIAKNPQSILYLTSAGSEWAADLTAAQLDPLLHTFDGRDSITPKEQEQLEAVLSAMAGKCSARLLNAWRTLADRLSRLTRLRTADGKALTVSAGQYGTVSLDERAADILLTSLAVTGDARLRTLAQELYAAFGAPWLTPAVTADILAKPADAVFTAYSPCFVRSGLLRRETEQEAQLRGQVLSALGHIACTDGRWAFHIWQYDPRSETMRCLSFDIAPPDPRWYALLTDPRVLKPKRVKVSAPHRRGESAYDDFLTQWAAPQIHACCETLGAYFRQRGLQTGDYVGYGRRMRLLGWTDWTGFVPECAKKKGEIVYSTMRDFLQDLDLTPEQLAAEVEAVWKLSCSGKLKFALYGKPSGDFEVLIRNLRTGNGWHFD